MCMCMHSAFLPGVWKHKFEQGLMSLNSSIIRWTYQVPQQGPGPHLLHAISYLHMSSSHATAFTVSLAYIGELTTWGVKHSFRKQISWNMESSLSVHHPTHKGSDYLYPGADNWNKPQCWKTTVWLYKLHGSRRMVVRIYGTVSRHHWTMQISY